jgi:hypothetical protein
MFSVYFVTGTKNPDVSQEGMFRISKKNATIATTEIRLTIINFRKEMALLYSKHGSRGARDIWRRTYGVRKLPAASTFKYHFDNLNKNQSLENQVSLWNIFHENHNYKYCFQYHRTSM